VSNSVNSVNEQNDHWIITTGAQQNPEDYELSQYADQHRLRVLGGIAALKSSNDIQSNFIGRLYSFLPLSDTTHLPFHINGTWSQGSDRGKLLIEKDDLPDLDHHKLDWNRHILLDFLPKVYCKFLEEIVRLQTDHNVNDHPISKFWPFPSVTRNYPKYAVEYGFKVLKHILQNDEIFQLINGGFPPDEDNRIDILFNFLPRKQKLELRNILRNNWDEISNYLFKVFFFIWSVLRK